MEQACRLLLEVSQGHGECIDALSKSEVLSRIVHLVSRVSLDFSFSLLEVLKVSLASSLMIWIWLTIGLLKRPSRLISSM